jgi:hypothetical protein
MGGEHGGLAWGPGMGSAHGGLAWGASMEQERKGKTWEARQAGPEDTGGDEQGAGEPAVVRCCGVAQAGTCEQRQSREAEQHDQIRCQRALMSATDFGTSGLLKELAAHSLGRSERRRGPSEGLPCVCRKEPQIPSGAGDVRGNLADGRENHARALNSQGRRRRRWRLERTTMGRRRGRGGGGGGGAAGARGRRRSAAGDRACSKAAQKERRRNAEGTQKERRRNAEGTGRKGSM